MRKQKNPMYAVLTKEPIRDKCLNLLGFKVEEKQEKGKKREKN